jgi:hypothetical protein
MVANQVTSTVELSYEICACAAIGDQNTTSVLICCFIAITKSHLWLSGSYICFGITVVNIVMYVSDPKPIQIIEKFELKKF